MPSSYLINSFFNIKCQINSLFLFFVFTEFTNIYISADIFGAYPKTLLMQNQNIFLANINGMYIVDAKFTQEIKSHPYTSLEVSSSNINIITEKTLIVQFPEANGMIICLVFNKTYFFDSTGDYLFMDNINDIGSIYSSFNFNLLTYKKENNYYHYILVELYNYELNIFHYKANNTNNELIYKKTFKPFYFDYPEIRFKGHALGCQIMNSKNKGDVVTCCFQTEPNNFIVIQSFIIENNFEEIGEDVYTKIESPDATIIRSLSSHDKKKLLTCYYENNNKGYCLTFDIDSNEILTNEPLIEECTEYNYKFNLFYIKKTNKYAFICSTYSNRFTIMLMDENFNIINKDSYSRYNFEFSNYFNTFNLIYDEERSQYAFIMDVNNNGNYITNINYIDTDFNASFPGSNKPLPFDKINPPTNEYNLSPDNKYYLNVINNYHITSNINDFYGKIIDFLDEDTPILLTKDNKPINSSLYALNLEINNLKGKLKYVINNTEYDIISNEKRFGVFKLKYYPPLNIYKQKDTFNYKVFLRNYSKLPESYTFEISICPQNCTCIEMSNCIGCVNGYSFYQNSNCIAICRSRFYINNETENVTCLDEEINECPNDYPIYNNYTKECKQIGPDIFNYNEEIIDNPTQENSQSISNIDTQTDSQSYIDRFTTIINIEEDNLTQENYYSESNIVSKTDIQSYIDKSTIILNNEKDNPTQNQNNELESTFPNSNVQSDKIKKTLLVDDSEDISTLNLITNIINTKNKSDENQNSYLESENIKIKSTILTNIIGFDERISHDKISTLIKSINDYEKIKDLIELENSEEINQPDKVYLILSSMIKNGNINMPSNEKDIILRGNNIIYQITNTENQKKLNQSSDFSSIDLGECEKIIKRNISYEDDPTPLIILKFDIKKEGIKSPLVGYEVYNPYTKEKINLNICSDVKITIISPVNLTSEETSLYNELIKQGYDIYDSNDSFYQDICTQFTSKNKTDVILIDRKNNFYDENATFCENSCSYGGINTENKKVFCYCDVKDDSMNFESHNFDKEKFLENFYKVEDYTNYQVLFCYKLVFSSKGLKSNICFYIFIVFFILFLSSMIVNLFKALKKIDEIIFKILQAKFMFEIMKNIMTNKKIKNFDEKNDEFKYNNNKKKEVLINSEETSKKLSFFQTLKYRNNKDNNDKKSKNKINNKNKISLKKSDNNINNIQKQNLNYRMSCKVNYSNNIRNKNFKLPNLHQIINRDNKISSSILVNNNENVGNSINLNNINNNSTNNSNINNNNIYNNYSVKRNIRKSCGIIYFNRYNHHNSNKILNEINPNPPLRKYNKNFIKYRNYYYNQSNLYSSGNVSENNSISKGEQPLIKSSLKSKRSKISTNKLNDLNVDKNSTISKNFPLVNSIKNEEVYSKKQLLQKSLLINNINNLNNEKKNIIKIRKNSEEKKENKNIKYIDAELNKMNYETALIYDKRTYKQYYMSLLKNKHLIFLVFISNEDYNVFLLKFSLFIISISLFFALNTLFFRDSTMRYIFTNEGKYDLLYQIPQVLYSTIISSIMTIILKHLSLSQMTIIEIKKETDKLKTKKIVDYSKKCLKIKLYFFFFIGLFLIIFCWYYVTAFGAVYSNTQLHLIKDTLISFGISMIYPFVINILPGLLRMPALKAENKDQKCIYNISKIIAFL